jgi:hypothetical protein
VLKLIVFVIEKGHFWTGPPECGFGASKYQPQSPNVLKLAVFVIEKNHFWTGPPESGFGASK